ncbi:PREDICTED: glutathione S-transferase T2-like [Brassica oleracea var. oleracea]|uniref:glutathione S-transferase T2-like n=1 Tax=Brassica oleracea var. oleracea TaxID=109376 RepID=UPI0006A74837|nr:PREDICTED: glutathione S-transferase T2-like [Brassica oleracea var. oleracea]
MAHDIFFNDYKVKFTLEHAWLERRHDQKWSGASSTRDKVSSKRRKLDDSSAQSSTSVAREDEVMARPVGVKAAKAKGRRKAMASEDEVKSQAEFQSCWDIRQKDFALKEQLNKQKLLDSLIAKTEPLSELEIALKNKLITDMLSSGMVWTVVMLLSRLDYFVIP